ncbi:MAG: hypothetical protein K0S32_2530 [Bacteroidetes bacterium]|jgi:photosystem II stability/assembly factor-like uncharacterized protein|nr:hypothetical protein [Bacteroidota bacterium]
MLILQGAIYLIFGKISPMKNYFLVSFSFLCFLIQAQVIKTKPYWQQLKTDEYKGKQDDIYFLNDRVGWYCNGSGKIYRTVNGGTDWKLCFEQKGTFFRCIAFADSLVGFAGNIGTDYFPGVTDTVPLYKTTDGGNTWTAVSYKGPTVKGLCALDIYREPIINSGNLDKKIHVFAGGRVGSPAFIMTSHDNGNTFVSQDMNINCSYILDIKFFNLKEGIICAASNTELDKNHALIIMTNDGGKTWNKKYESKRPYEITWKCSFPSPKVGYVTVQSYDTVKTSSQRYVAKTTDGGNTWKEIPLVNDISVREFGIAFMDEKHGWVGAVPTGFETFDGGKTWGKSYMGPATNKIRIVTKPNGEKIAIAIGAIVSKNKDVISDGYDAIAAMRNAYAGGRWYKNFTFSQETRFFKNGKEEKMEVWHEASSSPGKLLIKFKTKDSKDGVLFANNMVYGFKENEKMVSKPKIHDLCLAAFDVYFLKPYETTHILDSLGYNLKLVREDIFEGRKVFVVGATKNDSTSNQVWIDAERFYMVRLVYKQGKGINDCIFTDYKSIENNWVATRVVFKQNGIVNMTEKYFDIKFPKELSKDLFDPEKFNEVKLE